jgi:hypothetical protein
MNAASAEDVLQAILMFNNGWDCYCSPTKCLVKSVPFDCLPLLLSLRWQSSFVLLAASKSPSLVT